MRVNQPISQRELPFPSGESLISVTDLKGRITYCNAAFIEVSGFSRDELLGQPHNLVRHPDMPAEAFRDMWATIESGLPWTGLVKNRRKNGDHYWVQANATPMKDGERIVGYLSVRTEPSREAVQAAESLYATMREEAATGRRLHVLHHGAVRRADLAGRVVSALRLGAGARLAALQLALAAAVIGAEAAGGLPAAAAVALFGGLGVAWLSLRTTLGPIEATVADAYRMAAGDLTHPVTEGAEGRVGELQLALRQMAVNLRAVVRDTRQEVLRLESAAREIAAGAGDLSGRTESQAGSLEQTAASMEEINSTVQNSAAAAAEGARLAARTTEVSQRSNAAVQAVADTMTGIADSSRRIGEIVHVIEGVAFQTNILALNAAVEAARAGEQGRGFAVVASEVRSLAQRTTVAAKEIKQLIAESSERVDVGNHRTQDAQARMTEALQAVAKVGHTLEAISTAAAEQQNGIAQINEAVSHMDGLTQQNAAMVEQLAASSSGLSSQVASVNDSMRLFRLQPGDVTVAERDAVAMRREAHEAGAATPTPPGGSGPATRPTVGAAAGAVASRPAAVPAAAPRPAARAAAAPALATTADDDWTEI
jgi:aerotaxis receptor